MTVLHPLSSIEVARLAVNVIDACAWTHANRAEARDIIARMERSATFGPAEDSPGARVMDAHARRLSTLACTAYEAHELIQDGRDLSWLWDPAMMDAIHRSAYAY